MTSPDLTFHRVRAAVSALWSAPTWRATRNVLAAFLVALVGGLLLGGLGLIWGAAIGSLVDWPVGGWEHAALYIAVVLAAPVLALWAVQGLTALQRSRLHATLGVGIPARSGAAERRPWPIGPWLAVATWRQLGFHLLSILTGVAGGGLVAACWLAPQLGGGAKAKPIRGAPGWRRSQRGSQLLDRCSDCTRFSLRLPCPWLSAASS